MGWVRGAGAARSACLGVAGSLCVSAGRYWGGLSRGTAVFVVHSRAQAGTGILGKALFKHSVEKAVVLACSYCHRCAPRISHMVRVLFPGSSRRPWMLFRQTSTSWSQRRWS